MNAKIFFQQRFYASEMEITRLTVGLILDYKIDIGFSRFRAASPRTEKVDMRNPKLPDGGLVLANPRQQSAERRFE